MTPYIKIYKEHLKKKFKQHIEIVPYSKFTSGVPYYIYLNMPSNSYGVTTEAEVNRLKTLGYEYSFIKQVKYFVVFRQIPNSILFAFNGKYIFDYSRGKLTNIDDIIAQDYIIDETV